MTTEKIDKRISEFRFWKNMNGVLMIVCFVLSVIINDDAWKVIFRYNNLFFLSVAMSCKWFEVLYTDMKEE